MVQSCVSYIYSCLKDELITQSIVISTLIIINQRKQMSNYAFKPFSGIQTYKPNTRQQQPLQSEVQDINQNLVDLKQQLQSLAKKGEELGFNSRRQIVGSSEYLESLAIQSTKIDPLAIDASEEGSSVNKNKKLSFNTGHQNNNKTFDFSFSKQLRSFRQNRSNKAIEEVPSRNDKNNQEMIRTELKLQLEIKQLKETILALRNDLHKTKHQNDQISQELSDERRNGLKILEELQSAKLSLEQCKHQIALLTNRIAHHQSQLKEARPSLSKQKYQQFDQALKEQLEQNKQLKLRLQEKADELDKVRYEHLSDKQVIESHQNDLKVMEVKNKALCNSIMSKMDIKLNDKENQLQTVKRTVESLEMKYRSAVRQIQQKDQFILSFLVGRSKQEMDKKGVEEILEKYIITFPENKTMKDLMKEQQQILKLSKEISELKARKP